MALALPLGKLTVLIGAGLVGSVLAKEGSLPDVSNLVSGAFKIVFRQLKQEEPAKSATKPHNDTLLAQVNSLRHELQLLSSSRPITIVTTAGPGGRKYGFIIIIGVIGYGYVWWKGWKLPDFMFATRRSLSDACDNVGNKIDGFYSSLSVTKRELSSDIDRICHDVDANTEIIHDTARELTQLRDGTANMKDDVRSVFDAVETLASKVYRIEGNQDITLKGVGALHAQCRENRRIQESNQALPSTSSMPAIEAAPMTPSSRTLSLPPVPPRESQSPSTPDEQALPSTSSMPAIEAAPMTPSSRTLSLPPVPPRESQSPSTPDEQSHGPLLHTQSMSGLKDISESSSSQETFSIGTYSGKATGNGASGSSSGLLSRFSMPKIVRTLSAVNKVPTN